jgi:hypothetical protein
MGVSTSDVPNYIEATWYLPRLATGTDTEPTNVPTPNDIVRLQADDHIIAFGIGATNGLTYAATAILTGA